jgi:hypothetical protein
LSVVSRLHPLMCYLTTSITASLTTFHVCKTRGRSYSFRLLMMGGVSPETCWASFKIRNNKILMHCCILLVFLLFELYYDQRIHEHQVIECFSQNVDMNNIILSYGRLYFLPIHNILPCHLYLKKKDKNWKLNDWGFKFEIQCSFFRHFKSYLPKCKTFCALIVFK